jgi:hypothetical protein
MKNSENVHAVAIATMKLRTICLSEREASSRLRAFFSGNVQSLSLSLALSLALSLSLSLALSLSRSLSLSLALFHTHTHRVQL